MIPNTGKKKSFFLLRTLSSTAKVTDQSTAEMDTSLVVTELNLQSCSPLQHGFILKKSDQICTVTQAKMN